jgi:DNA-binding LacI/PurR family transcriptional regulator
MPLVPGAAMASKVTVNLIFRGISFSCVTMTTRELARLSGVSSATVSLALRNHPRISKVTKNRIVRLARKHGYVVDGRVAELMGAIRIHGAEKLEGCLGLISLYPKPRPWEDPARNYLQRIQQAAVQRAAELGYRIEPFWVREPGLRPERLAAIMEARGIAGLLSLGALELEDEIPAPLQKFTIVTSGTSIHTRVHRVVSHFSQNANRLLMTLKERGYRRPGAILQQFQDGRNLHQIAGIYLYFTKYVFGDLDVPIFYATDEPELSSVDRWFRYYQPDVIIYGEYRRYGPVIEKYLKDRGLRVPRDVGLALIDSSTHPENMSGVRPNMEQCGKSTVELLVSVLQQRQYGLPANPTVISVEGNWVEGKTIRATR